MIETLDDIIEELADKFGIYGIGPGDTEHPADCKCRICFTAWLRGRIESAVGVERKLKESVVDKDNLVTDENRKLAVDEIIGQLIGGSIDEVEIKVLRDYANKLLDESEPFSKSDLSASVAAYSDGFTDARKLAEGKP